MNASKENARKALEYIERLMLGRGEYNPQFLKDFTCACIRKLPSEAAYKRDRSRRNVKATA